MAFLLSPGPSLLLSQPADLFQHNGVGQEVGSIAGWTGRLSFVLIVLGVQEAEDLRNYFNSALSYPAVNPVLFHSLQQSLFYFVTNRNWQPNQWAC